MTRRPGRAGGGWPARNPSSASSWRKATAAGSDSSGRAPACSSMAEVCLGVGQADRLLGAVIDQQLVAAPATARLLVKLHPFTKARKLVLRRLRGPRLPRLSSSKRLPVWAGPGRQARPAGFLVWLSAGRPPAAGLGTAAEGAPRLGSFRPKVRCGGPAGRGSAATAPCSRGCAATAFRWRGCAGTGPWSRGCAGAGRPGLLLARAVSGLVGRTGMIAWRACSLLGPNLVDMGFSCLVCRRTCSRRRETGCFPRGGRGQRPDYPFPHRGVRRGRTTHSRSTRACRATAGPGRPAVGGRGAARAARQRAAPVREAGCPVPPLLARSFGSR